MKAAENDGVDILEYCVECSRAMHNTFRLAPGPLVDAGSIEDDLEYQFKCLDYTRICQNI